MRILAAGKKKKVKLDPVKDKRFLLFWKRKDKLPVKIIPKVKKPNIIKRIWRNIVIWWYRPEAENWWTIGYYGERGSGKTLEQGRQVLKILRWLKYLYWARPDLKRAIIWSNQLFSKEMYEKNKGFLYRWEFADELQWCPRENCWRGKKQHPLHGAYLMFDDISKIFPPDNWRLTPMWLRDYFIQGRKYEVHTLFNLQDPQNVDLNVRRYLSMAKKFHLIFGNRSPDETKPEIKRIFGMYRMRRIRAEDLWTYGDMSEQQIRIMLLEQKENEEAMKAAGKRLAIVKSDSWIATYRFYGRHLTSIYDTKYIVNEYKPKGFSHSELHCLDPNCDHKKVIHEIV